MLNKVYDKAILKCGKHVMFHYRFVHSIFVYLYMSD